MTTRQQFSDLLLRGWTRYFANAKGLSDARSKEQKALDYTKVTGLHRAARELAAACFVRPELLSADDSEELRQQLRYLESGGDFDFVAHCGLHDRVEPCPNCSTYLR